METDRLELQRTYLTLLDSGIFPELKGEVVVVRVDEKMVALAKVLGLPDDGKAFRIRSGFMCYDKKNHLLAFARNKTDLPRIAKQGKKEQTC